MLRNCKILLISQITKVRKHTFRGPLGRDICIAGWMSGGEDKDKDIGIGIAGKSPEMQH